MPAHSSLFAVLLVGLAAAYALVSVALSAWTFRARRTLTAEISDEIAKRPARPGWEYRSTAELLGWPLVHIRIGGGLAAQRKPVKAWIAAGDTAIGGIFAFGGMAIAPFSIGGCAIGLVPFGGMALGPLALGGFAMGIWSFGGLALGWQAYGGCAIAWNAAAGGAPVGHHFALGGMGHAAEANTKAATSFMQPILFFRTAEVVIRYMAWVNLLWVVPMIVWWRATVKGTRSRYGTT